MGRRHLKPSAHGLKIYKQNETNSGEYSVHVDEDIMFLWLMQAPTPEDAETRISELIEKINHENDET